MKTLNAILFTLFLVSLNALAIPLKGFPKVCETIGYEFAGDKLVLNQQGDQTIYFLQNISAAIIEIEHKESTPDFMAVGWQAKLNYKKWASFAVQEKNMNFRCHIVEKGKRSLTDCQQVLRLCQYPRVKFALSNQGTYWISINKSLRKAMSNAINKGILLRW